MGVAVSLAPAPCVLRLSPLRLNKQGTSAQPRMRRDAKSVEMANCSGGGASSHVLYFHYLSLTDIARTDATAGSIEGKS